MSGNRILVVDDNVDIAKMIAIELNRSGYAAVDCNSGNDALLHYHEAVESNNPFSLLIIDVAMPDMDGFTVGGNVRNVEEFGLDGEGLGEKPIPRTLQLYITAHPDIVRESTLLKRVQADGYLEKPFRSGELLAEVDRLMGGGEPSQQPKAQGESV